MKILNSQFSILKEKLTKFFHLFFLLPFRFVLITNLLMFPFLSMEAQQLTECNFPSGEPTLCDQIGSSDIDENHYIKDPTYTSQLGTNNWDNVSHVWITSDLIVDSDFSMNFSNIQLNADGRIIVTSGGSFHSIFSKYFSCILPWQGIQVEDDGKLQLFSSHLEGALSAVKISNSDAEVVIAYSKFNSCVIDIEVDPNVYANAVLVGNVFTNYAPISPSISSIYGIKAGNKSYLTVGDPVAVLNSSINSFQNHDFGVYSSNANLRIFYADFSCNRKGIESYGGAISILDGGGVHRSRFFHNNADIITNASSLNVDKSDFYQCRTNNIQSFHNLFGQRIGISNNNIYVNNDNELAINNTKTGIVIDRSSGVNSSNITSNSIFHNVLYLLPYTSGNARSAITVNGFPGSGDNFKMTANQVELSRGGTPQGNPPLTSHIIDININSANNFDISGNKIFPSNDDDASLLNRWGFYLHGYQSPASGTQLYDNHVYGNESNFDFGMCAYHSDNCGPITFRCNTSDKTLRGFHFTGSECFGSVLIQNTMGDHRHSTVTQQNQKTAALLLDSNTELGLHSCRKNKWDISDYGTDLGAWHVDVDYSNSLFKVDQNNSDEMPFPTDPDMGWFTKIECSSDTDPCDESKSLQEITDLDDRDKSYISSHTTYNTPINAMEWEVQKSILGKLIRYPSFSTESLEAEDFYRNYQSSSSGLFASFDALLNLTMTIDAPRWENLEHNKNQSDRVLFSLDSLDGIISVDSTFKPGTSFFTYRSTLLHNLQNLIINKSV